MPGHLVYSGLPVTKLMGNKNMKIALNDLLLSYDGTEVKERDGPDAAPITIRKALEIACLSADPNKWKTGDQKYEVYAILKRVFASDGDIEFNAAETLLLKELIGAVYGPGVVGVVYDILDPPNE